MTYCPRCASEMREHMKDEKVRHICSSEACGFTDWNNPTPVVAAIIEYESQVLLVHSVGWPPKMLGLVSGFLEADEHPDAAIQREIKEETNLETQALRFLGHYPFSMQNQIIMVYEAKCSGDIQLNEELDRYKLLDVEKVIPWDLGTGPAVKDWLSNRS